MIELRQSTLESFRRVCACLYGADEEELVAYVRAGQTGPANEKMRIGTAWHAVIENAAPFWDGKYWFVADGYKFHKDAVAFAGHHTGPGLLELPGAYVLSVNGQAVRLTGTADHVRGLVVQDHKTKVDTDADPCAYEDSLQWRVYLLAHRCEVFRYNLWQFKLRDDRELDLKDVVCPRFWRYPNMKRDVGLWVGRFLEWAQARRLTPYLAARSQQEAARG